MTVSHPFRKVFYKPQVRPFRWICDLHSMYSLFCALCKTLLLTQCLACNSVTYNASFLQQVFPASFIIIAVNSWHRFITFEKLFFIHGNRVDFASIHFLFSFVSCDSFRMRWMKKSYHRIFMAPIGTIKFHTFE